MNFTDPTTSARRRRPVLVSLVAAGAVSGLLGIAGVFASGSDSASTGTNRYQTDELARSVDLQLADASGGMDSPITCGEFAEDLTTGLINHIENGQLDAGELDDNIAHRAFCVRNVGTATSDLSVSALDIVSLETGCTGDEATVDETCGYDNDIAQEGELGASLYQQVALADCASGTGPTVASPSLVAMSTTPMYLDPIEPGSTRCFIVFAGSRVSDAIANQSDVASWRYRFDATDAAPKS